MAFCISYPSVSSVPAVAVPFGFVSFLRLAASVFAPYKYLPVALASPR